MNKFKDWFLGRTTNSEGYVTFKGKVIVLVLFFIFVWVNLIVISLVEPFIKLWILAIIASLGVI